MKTNEAAAGRWREILPQFDIPAAVLDGRHHPCPCTGEGEDRFRFSDRNGSGNYFCHCSEGDKGGLGLIMCKSNMAFSEAAKRVDEIIGNKHDGEIKPRQSFYSHMLRAKAVRVNQSAYLKSRGLHVPPGIQFARSVRYQDDDVELELDAMLAPITRNGEFLTYHVTYLYAGAKAKVKTPRKILPGLETRGGACALYPAAEHMGVGEGVETCIAASMLYDMPVWAALNTALLKNFEPPKECRYLTIYADNDANFAGHAAAYHLAHRLSGKVEVVVAMPKEPGTDWNDVLLAQGNTP